MIKKTLVKKCVDSGIEILNPSDYTKKDLIGLLQTKAFKCGDVADSKSLKKRISYNSPCL